MGPARREERERPARWPSLTTAPHSSQTRHAQQAGSPPAEKLWPMFFLAHVPGRHRAGRLAVWLIPAGVALLSPGLLLSLGPLAWAGAVVLAAGLAAHLASLAAHVRHRRRQGGLHLAFVATAAGFLIAGAGLA